MGSVFKQARLRDNFPLTASVLTCSVCCRVIIQPALGLVFFTLLSCCFHFLRPMSCIVATATCLNPQQADFLAFTCASPTMHCTSRTQCTKECRYTCFFCFAKANHVYYNMIMISLHLQISWHEVHVSN